MSILSLLIVDKSLYFQVVDEVRNKFDGVRSRHQAHHLSTYNVNGFEDLDGHLVSVPTQCPLARRPELFPQSQI